VPKPRAEPPPDRTVVVSPATAVVAPPPKGFQTIAAPVEIPKVIPPVNLSERPFDPRDFTGRGVEGGVADGVVGGTGPVTDGRSVSEAVIYHAEELDAQVRLLAQPPLRYPPVLEAAGVEGSVVMEFVVGIDGRVEAGSERVLESSDPRFEPAAHAVVAGSRFAPARLRGAPVRQLVRQRYAFMVGR
jgi:protein TonB